MSQYDEEHRLDGPTCDKCGMVNCESHLGCERRVAIQRKSAADIAEGRRLERAAIVADLVKSADRTSEDCTGVVKIVLLNAAIRYERGEHIKESK